MKPIMNINELNTIEQLEQFLSGSQAVAFLVASSKDECYRGIQRTLVKFRYPSLSKRSKGVVVRFLIKITGYSRQQITRLVKQYRDTGKIERQQRTYQGFERLYTADDIRLLASLDERHNTLSGPATKKLCERAHKLFNQTPYQRLAGISVAHLYNLRKSTPYLRQRYTFEKTRPKATLIGERKKPRANGEPGFIRIDTVHQGDQDKQKGVYHINAVDEVTQFEVVCTVERISELYLIPAIEQLLTCFPFVIQGFHSDNGSEYINHKVAKLLQKLLIEFTKSRSRQTNDNALVESKNGSVIRKLFGYAHIPQRWAPLINEFNHHSLFPYINYHRPCYFPKTITDSKGKDKKIYPYDCMMTPYDRLKSIAHAEVYLKPGITFEILDKLALNQTDDQAAEQLQKERAKLFKTINERDFKSG
jgi:transposase InsO family protein